MVINRLDNVDINLEDGHKYALRDIKCGENIIKYGAPIGHAASAISSGAWAILVAILSLAIGVVFVMRVGGADMPITISLLNSLSGVAGGIAGMAINNPLLVCVGGIVGASGLILTQDMCKAMNRKLITILTGQTTAAAPAAVKKEEPVEEAPAEPEKLTVEAVGAKLREAKKVIIVPGYGMALSQAQEDVAKFAASLEGRGVDVKFAIHPVAGRMPGHMSVLLCEADIDYDKLYADVPAMLPQAQFIDIRDTLNADSYYFTDSHWRQEKLLDTARLLAESMGAEFTDNFTVNELDVDFKGVYHGQAALPLPAEKIYYLTNSATENAVVTDFEHMTTPDVYDMTKKDSHDPYEVFLSGPLSLVTVENSSSNGGHLVVFRDSFGSSVAPLLAGSYSKITLVDIRYLNPMMIPMVVRDIAGADVLFLYSTSVINNGDTIK